MASCRQCQKSGFGIFEVKSGLCPTCRKAADMAEASKTDEQRAEEKAAREAAVKSAGTITLSTETFIAPEALRLGIVSGEVVLGMNVFKDIATNIRDVIGGRSGFVQDTMTQAREAALEDVRLQAAHLGANAVFALSIGYHSISTGSGTNMMIVSANGTAVLTNG